MCYGGFFLLLNEKSNVFITGASSGMGLSHAIYLISKGYNVTATYLPGDNLDIDYLRNKFITDNSKYKYVDKSKSTVKATKCLLSKEIQANVRDFIAKINFIPMDVTDTNSVKDAVQKADRIDVLINNAGVGYFGTVEELAIEKVRNQFEINFFGYLRVLQEVVPQMRDRRSGRIINITSLAAVLFIPFQAHYSATKAALLRLTEGLQMELRPFGIKVSAVLPSDINTSFNSRMVYMHNGDTLRNITDISNMKNEIPVRLESPYYPKAEKAWNTIIQNLIISPSPIVISKKIEKIIKAKRPKIHYKAGMKFQTFGLNIMNRMFPENLKVRIMAMLYQ